MEAAWGVQGAQGAKYPEHSNPAILLMGSANGGPVVKTDSQQPLVWPAWVYCTLPDRPSSGEYPALGCACEQADAGELSAAGLGESCRLIPGGFSFSRLLSHFHLRFQSLPTVIPSFAFPGSATTTWEVTAQGYREWILSILNSGALLAFFVFYLYYS